MLCLNRKMKETILIDGGITITILDIRGDRVKVGIDAPDKTRIVRGEVPFEPHRDSDGDAE